MLPFGAIKETSGAFASACFLSCILLFFFARYFRKKETEVTIA